MGITPYPPQNWHQNEPRNEPYVSNLKSQRFKSPESEIRFGGSNLQGQRFKFYYTFLSSISRVRDSNLQSQRFKSPESEIQISRVRDSSWRFKSPGSGIQVSIQPCKHHHLHHHLQQKKKILLLWLLPTFYRMFRSRYYFVSICSSSSLSLVTFSCVSVLILQWLSSPHILTQQGLSHDTLQWL